MLNETTEALGDALVAIGPCYLYIVTRERNAYWGAQSRQYKGRSSLALTLDAAKQVAEEWRGSGSTFTIQKIPGLCAQGTRFNLVLAEFHSNDSFGDWDPSQAPLVAKGTPLTLVRYHLTHRGRWLGAVPSASSFVTGFTEGKERPAPIGERAHFRSWTSFSVGSNSYLQWTRHPGRHRASGVRKVATLIGLSDSG